MSLLPCRSIGGLTIQKDEKSKIVLVGNELVIDLTPTEYKIVSLLLENHMVEDEAFVTLFNTAIGDTHLKENLEKHIGNIRVKIRQAGLYIRRIHSYGYSLVASASDIARP